jgi:hypothetical protein
MTASNTHRWRPGLKPSIIIVILLVWSNGIIVRKIVFEHPMDVIEVLDGKAREKGIVVVPGRDSAHQPSR